MTDRLRLALAQMQPGPDPAANAAELRALHGRARDMGADVLLAPRGALTGWPCLDLPRRADHRAACAAALADLAPLTAEGPALVLGAPWHDGDKLHDALVVLEAGKVTTRRARHAIRPGEPFDPGPAPGPVALRGARLGLMCGEDGEDPGIAETLAETGAEVLVTLHADPFAAGWAARRMQQAVARVVETGLGFVLVNAVGGLDEEVVDGGSFALNPDRSLAVQLPRFEPGLVVTDWTRGEAGFACTSVPPAPDCGAEEEIWRALVLFLRGMAGAVAPPRLLVAPGGGLRAALAALLAVDALGSGGVRAVVFDGDPAAEALARAFGIGCEVVAAPAAATPLLAARLRAAVQEAMAAEGRMIPVAAGDVPAAGIAPLRHVGAELAHALARWRNAHRPAGLLGPAEAPIPPALIAAPMPAPAAPAHRLPPGCRIARAPAPRYPLRSPPMDPDA